MRKLRWLSTVLIVLGCLLVVDAVLAVTWQEPLSALYNEIQQDELEGELAGAGPTKAELKAAERLPSKKRLAFLAQRLRKRTANGEPLGKLRIPGLDLDSVMIQGTDPTDLRKGPAHYADTVLPGERGTVGVAGHRTTYGAPFRDVDKLERGDRIEARMPYARFVYRVSESRIVSPRAVEVLRGARHNQIVLSACHPKYSAAQRLVVFATLERIEPVKALGERS